MATTGYGSIYMALMESPDIETERLRLRRPVEMDAIAIADIVGDREVARRLTRVPHPYGESEARFFLEVIVPTEWVWAVTVRGSDALVGVVGLTPHEGSSAELGYWLAPALWGRGIATEAAAAVVGHGFGPLGLGRLTSGYFLDNPASGRVLEKLGFVATGRAMRPCLAIGTEVLSERMLLAAPTV